MNRFEIFSLLWIVFSVALVMGVGCLLVWLDDRKLRRHPAE